MSTGGGASRHIRCFGFEGSRAPVHSRNVTLDSSRSTLKRRSSAFHQAGPPHELRLQRRIFLIKYRVLPLQGDNVRLQSDILLLERLVFLPDLLLFLLNGEEQTGVK